MTEIDYRAFATDARSYGGEGFMTQDQRSRVPYGWLYANANAIVSLLAERDSLREQAAAILQALNSDAPDHEVYAKVAAMVTGIPVTSETSSTR